MTLPEDDNVEQLARLVNERLDSAELEKAATRLLAQDKQYSQDEIKDLLNSRGVLDKISGTCARVGHP